MRSYVLPVVLMACGAGLAAISPQPAPVERLGAAAQIDFDALHRQAALALTTLREAPERRIAGVTTF